MYEGPAEKGISSICYILLVLRCFDVEVMAPGTLLCTSFLDPRVQFPSRKKDTWEETMEGDDVL